MILNFFLNLLATIPIVLMAIFPTVTQLPFGMDPAVHLFIGTLKGILDVFPWLNIVFTIFLLGLGVKFALFTFRMVVWIISVIRG